MSNSPSPLFLAEKRSWSYWFADGLPQLLIGVSALLFGFYFITTSAPSANKASTILAFAGLALYLLLLLRAKQILEWLKGRLTYPRTGYAASPYFASMNDLSCSASLNLTPVQDPNALAIQEIKRARKARDRRLFFTYIFISCSSVPLFIVRGPWICVPIGIVMGLILWLGTRADRSVSSLVILGFPLVGFYVGALQIAPGVRFGYFALGAGFLFILAGLLSLLLYLRRNPVSNAPIT
jgi:hypothetical protein